jgi:protein-tyrosine phosphatase
MTSALAATSLVIYVMTREHIYALRHLPAVPPLRLMLAPHLPPAAAITSTREIDDPYGQNLSAYESCRDTMVAAIPALVTHIRDLLANATH